MSQIVALAGSAISAPLVNALSSMLVEERSRCERAFHSSIELVWRAVLEKSLGDSSRTSNLFKLLHQAGFDGEALGRVAEMNVSEHLKELLTAGTEMAQSQLKVDLAGLADTLVSKHEILRESAPKLLSAAVVFVLAALGRKVAETSVVETSFGNLLVSLGGELDQFDSEPMRSPIQMERVSFQNSVKPQAVAPAAPSPEPFERVANPGSGYMPGESQAAHSQFSWAWVPALAVLAGVLVLGIRGVVKNETSGSTPVNVALVNESHDVTEAESTETLLAPDASLSTDVRASLNVAEGMVAENLSAQPIVEPANPEIEVAPTLENSPAALAPPVAALEVTNTEPVSPVADRLQDIRGAIAAESPTEITSRRFLVEGILFRSGRPELEQGAYTQLTALADVLKLNKKYRYQIIVHTNDSSKPAANLGLSQLRAQNLKNQLAKLGVSLGRVDPIGMGDKALMAEAAEVSAGRVELALLAR